MDKHEKRVTAFTGLVLGLFVIAVLFAASQSEADIPECIPYDEAYATPQVKKLDDYNYQAFYVAKMWTYDPFEIEVPVGSEIEFFLTSSDVVHGFWIPRKNLNLMAVQGAVTKATITFDKPGIYPIYCHEYCGTGHQQMAASIKVNYPQ